MVSGMFCSYFHLILTLIWKNLHGLAKNHQKHMGFSSISPYFDLILTLIWPYFEVIFGNLGVCKNHGFYHIFHHFTIDFDAVSTENGLKNHCFCNVLQLVTLYYKVGGVFTDSWLETMVSGMFCSYFHLILTLIWKNLHGLAKNHQKHMGFSSISPYFDLILTLIWPYFEVIFGNLGVCKNHGFYHISHHFTIDFDAVSTENGLKNHCFCNVLQLVTLYYKVGGVFTDSWLETMFLACFAAIFTLFWRWFERIFMV